MLVRYLSPNIFMNNLQEQLDQLQEDYFLLEGDYIELVNSANQPRESVKDSFYDSLVKSADYCTVFASGNKYFNKCQLISYDNESLVLETVLDNGTVLLILLKAELVAYIAVECRAEPVTEIYNPDLGASSQID
jgi:hypothetical protein